MVCQRVRMVSLTTFEFVVNSRWIRDVMVGTRGCDVVEGKVM